MILAAEYGNQQWILQCMNGIQQCVQNSIQMLSGAPVEGNNLALGQGGQYQFPARTAQELQASRAEVADSRGVADATPQERAALDQGNVDMFEVLQQQATVRDPASQGMPTQEAPSEPRSDEWIV